MKRRIATTLAGVAMLARLALAQGNPIAMGIPQQTPAPAQFSGSAKLEAVQPGTMQLTLLQALQMGLRNNLGIVLNSEAVREAQAEKLKHFGTLLPQVSADVTESVQQNNLAAFGLHVPGVPQIVGPFGLSDARGYVSQKIFDWNAIEKERSARSSEQAAQFNSLDGREIVTLVVANQYLLAVTTEARVAAAQSQLETARTAYEQTLHMRQAGMVAGIDVLRAQVEMQARQQQLLQLQNESAKEKLDLGREIGLPGEQSFELADKMNFTPAPVVDLNHALADAYQNRADYRSALAGLRAAQQEEAAARAELYPSLSFNGNYGDEGETFGSSHGTFAAAGSLNIPIFAGGRAHADVIKQRAVVAERQAVVQNLRGEIDSDVRKAMLDVNSAAQQVQVTQQELDLAQQALGQARDRFAAGVADNLEVVQAQEAVANANEAYISSVYAHNIAKATLARAVGVAEKSIETFLGAGK